MGCLSLSIDGEELSSLFEMFIGGGVGQILLVVLLLSAGGGGFFYFFVLKPKKTKKVPADLDDFDLKNEDTEE